MPTAVHSRRRVEIRASERPASAKSSAYSG
jgi:hypothetical protein